MSDLQRELQTRLQGLARLVDPGEACHFCGEQNAVTFIPLAVPDPDAAGEVVKVDANACAPCFAKRQPRALVRVDETEARRLINLAEIEVEAYQRPLFVASKGVASCT